MNGRWTATGFLFKRKGAKSREGRKEAGRWDSKCNSPRCGVGRPAHNCWEAARCLKAGIEKPAEAGWQDYYRCYSRPPAEAGGKRAPAEAGDRLVSVARTSGLRGDVLSRELGETAASNIFNSL